MSAPAILLTALIVIALILFFLWLVYSKRYQKASKETAFVRTGFGGQKVVMNGGALVIPMLHEIIQVNMNTMRMEIHRANNQSLVTKDRLRMDVRAEFYIRVKPTIEDVTAAAQSLGRRTMNIESLKDLVEGKFINALRVVAAEMKMDELHQNRGEFVKRVQDEVGDGLTKNGLELESVSLSELDQTDKKFFNAQNAFDAQGLTLLTEMIQNRSKQRNAIERDTEIAIRKKDLEAERQKLDLAKEEEFSRLDQQREIEVRRATQQTIITKEQVSQEQVAREAELEAKKKVELAQLSVERMLDEERITKNYQIKTKDIETERDIEIAQINKEELTTAASIASKKKMDLEQLIAERDLDNERIHREKLLKESELSKNQALEKAEIDKDRELKSAMVEAKKQVDQIQVLAEKEYEQERIAKEQLVREKRVASDAAIELAEIEKRKAAELADLARTLELLEKNKTQILAQSELDKLKAEAVKLEEEIATTRQVEAARRNKSVATLEAQQRAETESIALLSSAEAKAKAAASQAETMRLIAGGEAVKIGLIAEAESQADLIKIKASERKYQVEAEGSRMLHEAENVLDPEKSGARIKMSIVEHLAEIIQASVKPIESIDGIKIFQVDGLHPNGGGGASGGSGVSADGNLADQLINSALRYRGQAPLVDAILKEIGISGGDMKGLRGALQLDDHEPSDDGE